MKILIITAWILGGIFLPYTLDAAMTGGTYEIYSDSFAVIDASPATSTSYSLSGSVAEPGAATTTSGGAFTLRGGFQAAQKGVLTFTLSAASVSLGTLSTTTVSSGFVTTTISTDSNTGYTLAIAESGNLASGANDINDVSDGAVTAGSEEYGIVTTGTDALLSSDTAISGSVSVAASTGAVAARQTTVEFRASMSANTNSGSYSHTVTFTTTVNP